MKKRSVLISGHPTSVSLEEEFWDALKEVARRRNLSVNALIEAIDATRRGNLSSAIRVHILNAYRASATGSGGGPEGGGADGSDD